MGDALPGGAPEPFVHRLRVRYAEIDGQFVVFNAHWLTYCDDACTRFVESLGFGSDVWSRDFDVMLKKAVLEWSGPARFDEWVDIAVRPTRLGNTSFDLSFSATVEGRPACDVVTTYVSVVPGEWKPAAIPAPLRAALESRLVPPP